MEEEQNRLDRLASGPRTGPRRECPAANRLAALAAGLSAAEQGDALLDHASRCDACGAMLRALVEDFAEETTEAESSMLESLESSKPDWQRAIACRMAQASRRKYPIPIRTWLARAAALIVALGAGWLAWDRWIAPDPERLLAEAYTRQRPFDFRIPGAEYAPLARQNRGGSATFRQPQALVEAKSMIKRALDRDPEGVKGLELEARTEMLERDPESAIAALQHALERKPDDPDLLAALGMAYALRAETQPDRAVDYGYAIEYLERSMRAKPKVPDAVFNLALVFEQMNSVDDAIRECRRYLDIDKSGDWRDEAQRHLSTLEQKKKDHRAALERISDKNPEHLLHRLDRGAAVEPEEYLNVAVTEWLPRRWEEPRYERVLTALAERFLDQHHDLWLRDVLQATRTDRMIRGLAALAEAVQANSGDESDRALEKSAEASGNLRAAGSEAAGLRADFEHTYALQRAIRSAECAQHAIVVERSAARSGYSWIEGQALLSAGTCRSQRGDFFEAHRDTAMALDIGRNSGYRDLELRASGILVGVQTQAGNMVSTWNRGLQGLKEFWKGSHDGIRAHQIYYNLERSADSLGLRQTAYVMENAEVEAVAATTRRLTEALSRAELGEMALKAERPDEAKKEFEQAGSVFDQLEATSSNLQYRTLGELSRAQAELAVGATEAARGRLERILPQARQVDWIVAQIRAEQILGDLLWNHEQPDDAKAAYQRTIDLSEKRLEAHQGFSSRAQLMRETARAYRGLVEVLWGYGQREQALRIWEWFRAGERPGPRGQPDLDRRRANLRNESFVAYAVLPRRVIAWLFDDRGIDGTLLAVKPNELDIAAQRFLRECADPASDRQALQRDSRQIYDWLVAPFAGRLDPARVLVIEPDGPVGAIPMQALMDESSRYLGERFAITIASGVADYQQRATAGPVNGGLSALVIAAPALSDEMTKTFPPLLGAPREAEAVAARFRHATLLTGKQASLQGMEQNRRSTELLHFAGHGFSNAGNGGLLLSPGTTGQEEAGTLTGLLMAERDWSRCRLAVLSACSAGTGETKGPVNPESLVRGLLWAGVARLIASRWNVQDDDGMFMSRFYDELLSGKDTATALQQAASRLRQNSETRHPYFWAGFQSFGTR